MDIRTLVSEMTLEEKASLCSGEDAWHTKAIERLGIPAIMVADGPHGLRKQDAQADHLGIHQSVPAVCFPTASATACAFDTQLAEEIGNALGEECRAEGVSIVLGPAINLKRSPLCGRNFEYFSEDPYLAGTLGGAMIRGVQAHGVGTSVKHFFANNQESRRMTISADIAERPMRELYLAAFEHAIKGGKPWTVMGAYNRINGTFACESRFALTDVLRDEWGFDGFVMSDWNAINDRVAALMAGLELEMPGSGGGNDAKIVQAVQEGTLPEAVLDTAVTRLLTIILKAAEAAPTAPYDKDAHHQIARRAATESMVLLKNDGMLPLEKGKRLAFIGAFAKTPRYQGGGSSHINSFRVSSALESAQPYADIRYAQGFDPATGEGDEAMLAEAVAAARDAEAAVLFIGLPDILESEGYDRSTLDLPAYQNRLVKAVTAVQPHTAIVLHCGSPILMPWLNDAPAVLLAHLGGQAVGEATCDLLFGEVSPSGKLAETWPLALSDNPSYLNFPGEGDHVAYAEGLFIGYRYYDKKAMPVQFPFGHGLSYSTFAYEEITVSSDAINEDEPLTVSVRVRNTGTMRAKESVQLYACEDTPKVVRPLRELKAYGKLDLAPGESGVITFPLDRRAFAHWDVQAHDWRVTSGTYTLYAGPSSQALPLSSQVQVQATRVDAVQYTLNSTLGDLMTNPTAAEFLQPRFERVMAAFGGDAGDANSALKPLLRALFMEAPLRALTSYTRGAITEESLIELLDSIN